MAGPHEERTPRGVPLNGDAIAVLEAERGKRPHYCFTFRGAPIGWDVTNTARLTALRNADITDFRFHDLRHTWASWHRQAGTSCDELKVLGLEKPVDGGSLCEVRNRESVGRSDADRVES